MNFEANDVVGVFIVGIFNKLLMFGLRPTARQGGSACSEWLDEAATRRSRLLWRRELFCTFIPAMPRG